MKSRHAIFAAGCFWNVQHQFDGLEGVLETSVGYVGGTKPDPSYEDVCSHTTGHAEAIRVVYDPERIGYGDLVRFFFSIHDPSQLDRQGLDVGKQYRSAIFYGSDSEKETAVSVIEDLREKGLKVVTQLEAASTFWVAEEYHQKYIEKRGILPKKKSINNLE